MLPMHLYENGGVEYKIGDQLTVEVGKRVKNGEELDARYPYEPGEKVTDTVTRTYTIVGFF